MFILSLYVFTVLLIFVSSQKWVERKPVVRTRYGIIEGASVYTDSSKIANSFLGIPYAAPPLEKLRFSPPQKHEGWNLTYQATKYSPRCPQLPTNQKMNTSEDCLYLNIWTPSNIGGNYSPLPVVLFLEGADFFTSSELEFSGQDLAAEGVIVVTANYRLNVFGFFCLGTSQARGNIGLLDQYFAILWIKENIKHFGGDADKLTLFGHSSGAVSVMLHMVSPRTAGLFQRAIVSSGSAVSPWQTQNDPIIASKEILRILGCSNLYTTDYLKCLRTKQTEHILQALQEYSESYRWTDMFLPVVDTFLPEHNRYLPVEPAKTLKEGTFLQVPILTGISLPITHKDINEWIEMASKGFSHLLQYAEKGKIPEILRVYKLNAYSKTEIFDLIKWKYISSTQGDTRSLFDEIRKLDFEAKIEAPHFLQLSYLLSSYVQPIFVYFLDDIGFSLNTTDNLATSELLLLFGPSLLKQVGRRRFVSSEQRISSQIKRTWIDFIIFGNPSPNKSNTNKLWRKYTMDDPYIETFGTLYETNVNNEIKERTERILFWNQLLPRIVNYKCKTSNSIPRELQTSPDPAAGFRHAMYTLVALVLALLVLLLICIVLLKRRSKERDRQIHLGY